LVGQDSSLPLSTIRPLYVSEHAWLFADGSVETGPSLRQSLPSIKEGIHVLPVLDAKFEETFDWAVDVVIDGLKGCNGSKNRADAVTV